MQTIIREASDSVTQMTWDSGGYISLRVDQLDDPVYRFDMTVTEGAEDDGDPIEEYYLFGLIDRVSINADNIASAVYYYDDDGIPYGDEEDCEEIANDFLYDIVSGADDILDGYFEGLGLNMNKLGFPAM